MNAQTKNSEKEIIIQRKIFNKGFVGKAFENIQNDRGNSLKNLRYETKV